MDLKPNAYFYNANRFKNIPGNDMERWTSLFQMINFNVSFIDRTGNIKMPIRTSIPSQLEMPVYDPNFSMTYEECCQQQAHTILQKQQELDVPIRLLYSGGIDSSLILASFIKEIGLAECEKRIQLVMSMDSIEENPWMWEKIIRRSNFKFLAGEKHSGDWGTDRILVGGEFNDQLMGSDIYRDLVRWRSNILDQPWTQTLMVEYNLRRGLTQANAEMWADIFSNHLRQAPCPVDTVADWWWWINFSCKWSSVYFRILIYAREYTNIDQSYLENYYCQFYGSSEFQKWSMVDRTHKHKGSFINYKWHARDLVADFLQGEEYKSKIKRGSLWKLLGYKFGADIVDQDYNYHMDITSADWYNPNNTFKKY
jgi:hypothetical protein